MVEKVAIRNGGLPRLPLQFRIAPVRLRAVVPVVFDDAVAERVVEVVVEARMVEVCKAVQGARSCFIDGRRKRLRIDQPLAEIGEQQTRNHDPS